MTNSTNLRDKASKGDPEAIASLLNRSLQSKGITAKARLTGTCLEIKLEGNPVPDKNNSIDFIRKGLTANLQTESVKEVKIYGGFKGIAPSWQKSFYFDGRQEEEKLPDAPVSVTESVGLEESADPVVRELRSISQQLAETQKEVALLRKKLIDNVAKGFVIGSIFVAVIQGVFGALMLALIRR